MPHVPFLQVSYKLISIYTKPGSAGLPPGVCTRGQTSDQCLLVLLHTIIGMIAMITNPGQVIIFGLPVYFYLGILTFIALISTAALGMLVLKGKFGVRFSWHMTIARLTIVLAVLHGILVAWAYLG